MPPLYGTDYFASRQAWIMVGTIFAVATVHHGYKLASNWNQRRQLIKSYLSSPPAKDTKKIKTTRLPAAISTATSNLLHLRTLPLWIYSSTTLAEALLTIVYTTVILFLAFYNTCKFLSHSYSASKGYLDFANQCGVMAFSQVILIVGLAGKNNTISFLTGISYQKLNYMHRASARVALLLSWLHSMERVYLGLTRDKVITLPYVQWGIVALISFTIVFLSSFRFVRHLYYEAFIILHLVFVLLFLVGAYMHYPVPLGYWIWPAFLLWGLDRIVRSGTYLFNHRLWRVLSGTKFSEAGDCTVELLEGDVMRVTIKQVGLKWSAGQHGYISIPSLSKLPKVPHPFSYANLPAAKVEDRDAIFIIRAYDGFTRNLANKFTTESVITIPTYLEGPYGTAHALTHNSAVLLVAGGTGITFIFSHFLNLLSLMATSKSAVRNIHLVWNVRHASHVSWIAPMLNQAVEALSLPEGYKTTINVNVTRSLVSSEPETSGEGAHGGLSGKVAETLAGHSLEKSAQSDSEINEKAGTGSSAPSISAESSEVSEGSGRNRELEEKEVAIARDLSFGLTPAAKGLITFAAGRADIKGIIEKDVAEALGPMNVTGRPNSVITLTEVCGPTELSLDTRRAVSAVSTGDKVLRGQHQIEFYHETFGW